MRLKIRSESLSHRCCRPTGARSNTDNRERSLQSKAFHRKLSFPILSVFVVAAVQGTHTWLTRDGPYLIFKHILREPS